MALSANLVRRKRETMVMAWQAVHSSAIYAGGYMALGSRDHATAANRGRIYPYNDELGAIPLGFALQQQTGNTGASPIPEAEVEIGETIVQNCAVTGAAGTYADVGRLVYATDDGTFTLTRPTIGIALGMIVRARAAGYGDVLFFSAAELAVLAMAGAGQQLICLGTVNLTAIVGAADVKTGLVMPFHGRINTVWAMVTTTTGGAGGTVALNLEIDGTNVTGGVVTIVTGTAFGTRVDGTAVTAANVFNEGSLIDVESSGLVAITGYADLYMEVTMEPGT